MVSNSVQTSPYTCPTPLLDTIRQVSDWTLVSYFPFLPLGTYQRGDHIVMAALPGELENLVKSLLSSNDVESWGDYQPEPGVTCLTIKFREKTHGDESAVKSVTNSQEDQRKLEKREDGSDAQEMAKEDREQKVTVSSKFNCQFRRLLACIADCGHLSQNQQDLIFHVQQGRRLLVGDQYDCPFPCSFPTH